MSTIQATAGIYVIRNRINGKTYIGSSQDCRRRWYEHRSRLRRNAHINLKLQAAWNKYGEAAFEFSVILSVFDRNQLEAIEQGFLDDLQAVTKGYNLAPVAGNTAGWKAPPETRKRMSDAAKRRDNSVQVKAMAEATRGKKRPQYVIDAMMAGKRNTPTTEETRQKMSASANARGDNMPAEARARLNAIHRAKGRFNDEQKADMARMKDEGATLRQIGAKYGITAESSVHSTIKKWRERMVVA